MNLIGKKLHSLLNRPSKRKSKPNTVSFESAKLVGVLFTYSDLRSFNEIELFINTLKQLKEVKVLCFNTLKDSINVNYSTVNMSELSNLGKLNSPAANDFINAPLDFLFHIDFELNEITQSILAKSKAKCRLGVYSDGGRNYYELMIGINKSAGITNFGEQLLKYAKGVK